MQYLFYYIADPYYIALVACVLFNIGRKEEGERFGYLLSELQGEDGNSKSILLQLLVFKSERHTIP